MSTVGGRFLWKALGFLQSQTVVLFSLLWFSLFLALSSQFLDLLKRKNSECLEIVLTLGGCRGDSWGYFSGVLSSSSSTGQCQYLALLKKGSAFGSLMVLLLTKNVNH